MDKIRKHFLFVDITFSPCSKAESSISFRYCGGFFDAFVAMSFLVPVTFRKLTSKAGGLAVP